jgi:hypothetical protein
VPKWSIHLSCAYPCFWPRDTVELPDDESQASNYSRTVSGQGLSTFQYVQLLSCHRLHLSPEPYVIPRRALPADLLGYLKVGDKHLFELIGLHVQRIIFVSLKLSEYGSHLAGPKVWCPFSSRNDGTTSFSWASVLTAWRTIYMKPGCSLKPENSHHFLTANSFPSPSPS